MSLLWKKSFSWSYSKNLAYFEASNLAKKLSLSDDLRVNWNYNGELIELPPANNIVWKQKGRFETRKRL